MRLWPSRPKSSGTPKRRSSTFRWTTIVRIVGPILGAACVLPALYYNLNWLPGASGWDNLWAGFLIVGSALVAEGIRHSRSWAFSGMALAVAGLLVLNNSLNAFENITLGADHWADHRKHAIVGAKSQSSERSEWSSKVGAARAMVGDKLASIYKSELEQYQQQNARRWNATKGCDVEHVTSSAAFCAEFARLKGLADTAEARDVAAAKVRKIDDTLRGMFVPTHADPFAAKMAVILNMTGMRPTTEGIRALKSLLKTLSIESLATFGLMFVMGVFSALAGWMENPKAPPRAASTGAREKPSCAGAETVTPAAERPPRRARKDMVEFQFQRWCAEALEVGPTKVIEATPGYRAFAAWCRRHEIEVCTQNRFGRMMREASFQAGFQKDENNGKPRYVGVGLKPKPSVELRVVPTGPERAA